MTRYSVAEAKTHLPRLIDRAAEGEEVLITRHGRVVAELRTRSADGKGAEAADTRRTPDATLDWLRERRLQRPRLSTDSLSILRDLADEQRW